MDLREPLNPTMPPEAQVSTLPSGSVMVMMVLLNVEWMNITPWVMTFLSFFLVLLLLFF